MLPILLRMQIILLILGEVMVMFYVVSFSYITKVHVSPSNYIFRFIKLTARVRFYKLDYLLLV